MNNEVTNFMFYMYNKWSLDESVRMFGKDLGVHIYKAFTTKKSYSYDYNLSWYADLDKECRQKIVDRANELYNK